MRGGLCVLMAGMGVALGGCGGGDDPAPASTPKPQPTQQPDRRAKADPTEQEIRAVANAYVKASSRSDWAAVCATLVRSEYRYFKRLGKGSCERVFRAGGRRGGKQVREVLSNSRASEIRIGREQAVIEVTQLGEDDVVMRLYAIEEGGRWGIARSKKRRERYPIESIPRARGDE